jgi:hypothetical protein
MKEAFGRWALEPSAAMPVPDWYPLISLAREWNVPPWELEDAPVEWLARGLFITRLNANTTVSKG